MGREPECHLRSGTSHSVFSDDYWGYDWVDSKPVVKLFTPDAQCTWLLTELGLDDIAYGLCDLGLGCPEIGFVCMRELREARGPLGLPIERDLHFVANKTLSTYADEARAHGRIVT